MAWKERRRGGGCKGIVAWKERRRGDVRGLWPGRRGGGGKGDVRGLWPGTRGGGRGIVAWNKRRGGGGCKRIVA